MSFEEKIGKIMMIGIPGTSLDEETKDLLLEVKPGSTILFSRNIESPKQVKKLIDDINNLMPFKPAIAVDQEGGIVTRLKDGFTVSPGTMAITATGNSENCKQIAKIMAKEMKALGINWNLAPVVDINNNPNNPGIGVRSFSDDAEIVVEYATKFVEGMREEGVMSCLKHFPGKGRVNVDAHVDLPELGISKEELMKTELKPFKEVPADSIMPSHIFITALQKDKKPCSLSKEILIDLARTELKYEGVLLSDDLGMGGVSNYFTPEEAAIESLKTGMDVLMYCHDTNIQKKVKKYLVEKVNNSIELQKRVDESYERFEIFRKKAIIEKEVSIEKIGSEENLSLIEKVTDESITAILEENILPLNYSEIQNVLSIKLTRLVQVEDGPESGIPYVAKYVHEKSKSDFFSFNANVSENDAEIIINKINFKGLTVLFSENAHLYSGQKKLISELAQKCEKFILIALRNPYDVFIPNVKNKLLTYGYQDISQKSLIKVLEGKISPKGKIPVIITKGLN